MTFDRFVMMSIIIFLLLPSIAFCQLTSNPGFYSIGSVITVNDITYKVDSWQYATSNSAAELEGDLGALHRWGFADGVDWSTGGPWVGNSPQNNTSRPGAGDYHLGTLVHNKDMYYIGFYYLHIINCSLEDAIAECGSVENISFFDKLLCKITCSELIKKKNLGPPCCNSCP